MHTHIHQCIHTRMYIHTHIHTLIFTSFLNLHIYQIIPRTILIKYIETAKAYTHCSIYTEKVKQ